MKAYLKRIARLFEPQIAALSRLYINRATEREWYANQRSMNGLNERPVEYAFALRKIASIYPHDVLDVGTGKTAWPNILATCGIRITSIDNVSDYWERNYWNRHWFVLDQDVRNPNLDQEFDFITCISVLEHIPESQMAVDSMFKLLRNGGYLLITCPFNSRTYHENIYQHPEAGFGQNFKYIAQVFSDQELATWVQRNNAEIVEEEFYEAFTGEMWSFGERLEPLRKSSRDGRHQLGCFLLRKR